MKAKAVRNGAIISGEAVIAAFPPQHYVSALCLRMWWSNSTQAWGTWSTWGRAMRNQSQVNTTFAFAQDKKGWHLINGYCFAYISQNDTVTWWCLSVSTRSDDPCWKGLFWCSVNDRRECHHLSSLQRARWVSCESRLNLLTVSEISAGSAWYLCSIVSVLRLQTERTLPLQLKCTWRGRIMHHFEQFF